MITVHALCDKIWNVLMEKRDNKYMKKLVKNGEDLTIVGIVMPVPGAYSSLSGAVINRLYREDKRAHK